MRTTAMIVAAGLCACSITQPQAHRTPVNGLSMYYEETGSGPPLLLLHGGGSTAQTSWGAMMPKLARNHRVIAPEQREHGHTGHASLPLSFEQEADDTAALLEQLGVREVDVMGFSNGGVVALQLAIRHPQLVRRLVICSAVYARAGFPPQFWEGMKTASTSDMPRDLYQAMLAAAPSPSDVPLMFAQQVALMNSFADLPEEALRAIGKPALVMSGDGDVMPPEHTASLARLLSAKLAVLPGSGHGDYLGAVDTATADAATPALTLALVERFLADRL